MKNKMRKRMFYYFVKGVFEGAAFFTDENNKNKTIVEVIKEEIEAIEQLEK